MLSIGSQICKRRKFLGLTQESLADISGVSLRTLKGIELDGGNPSIKTLSKILTVIGMEINIEIKRENE